MAPKKKGGRKKEEVLKEPEINNDVVPEHSREFYLIQIRDLENRLARYQKKWDELQVSEKLFRIEYEKMMRDNKEIVGFLKKTLNQRVDEISDLTQQYQTLQNTKDSEKDAFETQLVQLRHEFQETKDQLTSENMQLSNKLAALEEFRLQKDEIMAKFADLEGQMTKQEEQHKEYIYNLERKSIIDKERLKKEMLHRVNAVAAEFRKVSNNQMAETTKRTIRENASISLQLTRITDQSLQLIQENDHLKEAHAEATKQLELLEQNEKKMAKNSLSNQKMIWILTEKCKALQAELDEHLQKKSALVKTKQTNERLQQQNMMLREELNMLKEETAAKLSKEENQMKTFQAEHQRRINAERVLKLTAQALREVLEEQPEQDGVDVIFQLRRNDALHGILRILQRNTAHLQAQPSLPPVVVENTLIPMSNSAEWRLKASRTVSHCNMFKMLTPRAIHSVPAMSSIHIETLRPYASITESLLGVCRSKENAKTPQLTRDSICEELSLPETVSRLTSQELLSK